MKRTKLELKDYLTLVEDGAILNIKDFNETYIDGSIEDSMITIISKNNTSSIIVSIFQQLSSDYYDYITSVYIDKQSATLSTNGMMIFLNEED